jgi:hypothetical protein
VRVDNLLIVVPVLQRAKTVAEFVQRTRRCTTWPAPQVIPEPFMPPGTSSQVLPASRAVDALNCWFESIWVIGLLLNSTYRPSPQVAE